MRLTKKTNAFFILTLLTASAPFFLVACQGSQQESSTQMNSKRYLKLALQDLDRGDDPAAEQNLQASLNSNPMNGRARTALASLYAKQAGVSLQEWLNPFLGINRKHCHNHPPELDAAPAEGAEAHCPRVMN